MVVQYAFSRQSYIWQNIISNAAVRLSHVTVTQKIINVALYTKARRLAVGHAYYARK